MSVQNESLEMKSAERKPEAPELAYKAASQDSLSMFFAAIGGAVLGMLATLLILALINGGTLNFSRPERLAVLEANLSRVNENVGAVSQNVDAISQQVTAVREGLAAAAGDVEAAKITLEQQGGDVADIQKAVSTLAVTGQQFDTFVAALDSALTSVKQVGAAGTGAAATAVSPIVVTDKAVKPDAVAVLFFVDANGNGVMDGAETNAIGLKVAVQDADGRSIGVYTSNDGGITVEGLAAGIYQFVVEDTAGQKLATADTATVTVTPDAPEGQIVYFPVEGAQ